MLEIYCTLHFKMHVKLTIYCERTALRKHFQKLHSAALHSETRRAYIYLVKSQPLPCDKRTKPYRAALHDAHYNSLHYKVQIHTHI